MGRTETETMARGRSCRKGMYLATNWRPKRSAYTRRVAASASASRGAWRRSRGWSIEGSFRSDPRADGLFPVGARGGRPASAPSTCALGAQIDRGSREGW